jgi:hypothetical protein
MWSEVWPPFCGRQPRRLAGPLRPWRYGVRPVDMAEAGASDATVMAVPAASIGSRMRFEVRKLLRDSPSLNGANLLRNPNGTLRGSGPRIQVSRPVCSSDAFVPN